jgi:hypothetical protein
MKKLIIFLMCAILGLLLMYSIVYVNVFVSKRIEDGIKGMLQ